MEGCNQVFETVQELRKHMKENHIKYTCVECDKVFKNEQTLKLHNQEKHGNKEPTLCPYPECSFSTVKVEYFFYFLKVGSKYALFFLEQKSNLTQHIRHVHQKEPRSYRCQVCNMVFTKNSEYRKHRHQAHPEKYPQLPPPPKKEKRKRQPDIISKLTRDKTIKQ